MNSKPITFLLTTVLMIVFVWVAVAQDNPNTTWAENEYPKALENIKYMVDSVWGNEDQGRNQYLVELHCLSLNKVLTEMGKENADWDILVKALDKWSRADVKDRGENWWDWPDTNWMKVESEYRFLVETKKDG